MQMNNFHFVSFLPFCLEIFADFYVLFAFLGPIGISFGLGSVPNTVLGSSHIDQQVFFSKSSSKRVNLNSSGWPGGWVGGWIL